MFGERYAYDFVRPDPNSDSLRFYPNNPLRYLIFGVPLRDVFGWGQPIYAPVDGTVVQAEDGLPERDPVHVVRDAAILIKNAWTVDPGTTPDIRALAGNFVLIESSVGYAVIAHAQTGSVRVSAGAKVSVGEHVANVGHSGNSTAPHLHFHLMDRTDLPNAQGILCAFREYEVLIDGKWKTVRNGVPNDTQRIRRM
jgi:murein DD-endopeptidase MepM/ murein hydrolase activator NlpD